MDASTILETANRYMEDCLEASKNTATCQSLSKETAINAIQNYKFSVIGVYSLAHSLIYKSGDEDEIAPFFNELETLYCDIYKPAFDKLLQEVKAK